MPKTLKKRKNRRTQKKRRTRQMTNNKTRRRRLKNSRSSGSRTRSSRSSRKMKGGVADGPGVGLISGKQSSSLGDKLAGLTSSFSSSQQPVAESGEEGFGYQQIPDSPEPVNTPQDLVLEKRIDPADGLEYTLKEFQEQYDDWKVRWDAAATLPPPPVQQPAVQQPPVQQPVVQQPAVQQPLLPVQQPVLPVQQPAVQQPLLPVQQPVVQQPVGQQPLLPVQQPAVQQPLLPVQQPVLPVQQPVGQQPLLPVQQPAVQQPAPLTREQVDAKKKEAADLMEQARVAVIEAGTGEAALARSRVASAVSDAAAAAAAAAEKAKPVAEGVAKVAAAGVGTTGAAGLALAAAPYIAAGAAAAAPIVLPTLAGLAAVGAGGVLGKKGVDKTIQFGKLAKNYGEIKTLAWAIPTLANEGWQFILPDKTVATKEQALAWIKKNYKSVTVNAPAKPDQPQLAGTPTPRSA